MAFLRRVPRAALPLLVFACTAPWLTLEAQPKREFRAAWVATVANLDWPSFPGQPPEAARASLISTLDQLKATGFTAVVFQVRSECDAMFVSDLEPWSYWLTGTQGVAPNPLYDPLQFAIEETHKRGMELHAWFNPYRAYRQNDPYTPAATHVTNVHPDWVITCPDGYKFLDPGLPAVREHVARVLIDVVRRYDVDGIHMDDYFYPYPEHNFTNEDAATFAAYPRGYTSLGDWRRDNVNLLFRMIRDSLAIVGPHVKAGVSPFGIWKSGVPPGIVGLSAYSDIYCDAIAWLREGSVDYLTPQLYWPYGGGQDYGKLMAWWADSTAFYGRHLYPGQAAYRIGGWPASEMPNHIRANRANPKVGGDVFFRANAGINDNPKGFADSLKNDLYRYEALHPVMAWKDMVEPFAPRGITLGVEPSSGALAILWELPLPRPNDDTAYRYAVYRFDHYPSLAEFSDPANMLSVEGRRYVVPPVPPPLPGGYYYAVTGLDRNYNESDTSNILRVGVPAPPVLAKPVDGATAMPDTVTVAWRRDPLASHYHVQVATDPAFASGMILDDSQVADTSRIVTGLGGHALHYWRVSSSGPGGASDFSMPLSFTTGFPAAPMLLSPPHATVDVPPSTTLVWSSAETATSYRVQVAKSNTFSLMLVDSTRVDTTMQLGPLDLYKLYYWRVKAANALGSSNWSATFGFRTVQSVGVAEEEGVPTESSLSQNYPNPFNPLTTIRFGVPQVLRVTITVFDMLGREQAVLIDRELSPGNYSVFWDASDASSGVYFYRMTAGSYTAVRRMVVLK